ncbi:MAG: hypothetical protein HOE82_02195 [Gammaproteobacteria bacterium]|jgi:hypothetical protein|nr:hypothetical protein [Gammaproteobacteria bacterium]MBT5465883.1 hypothetical protein [Candidatus Neomarinimicrobiota bacterium]
MFTAKSVKHCSTCEYWEGSRKTDSSGKKSTFSSMKDKGVCKSKNSAHKNKEVAAGSNCGRWDVWSELK